MRAAVGSVAVLGVLVLVACGAPHRATTGTGAAGAGGSGGQGGGDTGRVPAPGDAGGSADDASDAALSAPCPHPASQPFSAPCCPDRGIDACGAGLFCAAFDGRTQPTCYVERSRRDLHECGADAHCVSESCSPVGRCRSLPGSACEPEVGCASPAGDYFCDRSDGRCVAAGDGGPGSRCGSDEHCGGRCDLDRNRCWASEGDPCEEVACDPDAGLVCAWSTEARDDVCTRPSGGESGSVCVDDSDCDDPEYDGVCRGSYCEPKRCQQQADCRRGSCTACRNNAPPYDAFAFYCGSVADDGARGCTTYTPFGEPCPGAESMCEDHHCTSDDRGRYCTRRCDDDPCPDGWRCFCATNQCSFRLCARP